MRNFQLWKKQHFKKTRRLLLFDNILNQLLKIVNLNQRTNFEYLYQKKKLLKTSRILYCLENG